MEGGVRIVVLLGLAIGAGVVVLLVVLTALGARRRRRSIPVAVAAGLFFPVTWVCWYVLDEHPYRRARGSRLRPGAPAGGRGA